MTDYRVEKRLYQNTLFSGCRPGHDASPHTDRQNDPRMSRDPVPNRMRLQRRLVEDPQPRLGYGLFRHGGISRHCKVFGIGGRGVAVKLSKRGVAASSRDTHGAT
jgi:hypothetical protein